MNTRTRKIAMAAFIGAILGMLTFYYVRYMTPRDDIEVSVVRTNQYVTAGTKLKRTMVDVERVPLEFVDDHILKEDEIGRFVGKKFTMDVEANSLVSRYHFPKKKKKKK